MPPLRAFGSIFKRFWGRVSRGAFEGPPPSRRTTHPRVPLTHQSHLRSEIISDQDSRLLAARISERVVGFPGGMLFLLFAMHSLVAGPEVDE